jgi:hypothetical protein
MVQLASNAEALIVVRCQHTEHQDLVLADSAV